MIKKECLENIYRKYNKFEYISPDPLQFVHLYNTGADREIVALIAASFAYGNVKQIIKTVDKILSVLGSRPKQFLEQTTRKELEELFKGFKYRFTTEQELVNLLCAIKEVLKQYGSLENLFWQYYKQDKNHLAAQRAFAAKLRSYGKIDTLMPNPQKNSALKRLNLCLRWCIRKDDVDVGCWTKIPASGLIVPLDVHMHRVARMLGLTKRNQADMKTAVDISKSFAFLCPEDPVKYDFCLTRFGIRDDMSEKDLENI